MGVGMVTVVMAGAESSSDFSSSIRGTAGTSDDKSFRIFLREGNDHRAVSSRDRHEVQTEARRYTPIGGPPGQDLSPLLRIRHAVYRFLRVLALGHSRNLPQNHGNVFA